MQDPPTTPGTSADQQLDTLRRMLDGPARPSAPNPADPRKPLLNRYRYRGQRRVQGGDRS